MKAGRIPQIAVLAMLMICSLLQRLAAADDPATQPTGLDLLVVDSDGKPVPSAQITVTSDGKNTKIVTSTNGHVLIPLPKQATSVFSLAVHADGFVDKSADWRARRTDPIPAAYTLKLEMGSRITGKVVDDAGQPVAGAHIELWISKRSDNTRERFNRNASITTGSDGVWTLDGVPTQGAQVRAGAWDYHYANGDFFDMKQPSATELRDGTFTLTLTRGVLFTLTVLKPDGTPLAGAHVATGGQMASNRLPAQKTDKDGKVVYAAKPGDQVVLTVTAAGFATDMKQFVMAAEKNDESIRLAQSTPLTGRVVDPDGKPIPNAWIYPDTWRGVRSLDERIHADRNGKFIWKDPPADEVLCDVEAPNNAFLRSQNVPMTAGGQEIVVTLQRALHVSGTVVDAETNQPIPSFHIIRGISFDKDRPTDWQRGQNELGRNGQFQLTENFPYPGYAVRIEADGYTPAESRVFTADEKQVVLEMKLNKGQALTAVILTPDGKPAAGAKVMLLEPGQTGQIMDNGTTFYSQSPQAVAGPDGKCSFPAETGLFKLVAMDATGYVEINSTDFSKSGEVRLIAWGRVQGKLMHAGKPWPSQKIMLQMMDQQRYDPKQSRVFQQFQATTDADGAFTIDRIPAGKAQVGRLIETNTGQYRTMSTSNPEEIEVIAGQSVSISLGNKGRPVQGTVVLPPSLADQRSGNWTLTGSARTRSNMQPPPMPDDIKNGTPEQQQKWYKDFLASDAGKKFIADQQSQRQTFRNYPVEVVADGKFRIEDVVPGSYQLYFSIMRNSTPTAGMIAEDAQLAAGNAEFTVSEIPGGYSDEPQTLPELKMNLIPHVDVGDTAPDFTAKTSDGKDLKLSDFKGKYVLLDFFASSTPTQDADKQALQSAVDTFGGNDRFTIIGVNLFGSTDDTKAYTQKYGLSWTSATLNDRSAASPMQTYGIQQLPSILLIGPDGKVIAKHLHGDAIKTALTNALGPQGL
jgi:protocatechuate 3,4-dioxygenase beta subunit/peroxiredoxin